MVEPEIGLCKEDIGRCHRAKSKGVEELNQEYQKKRWRLQRQFEFLAPTKARLDRYRSARYLSVCQQGERHRNRDQADIGDDPALQADIGYQILCERGGSKGDDEDKFCSIFPRTEQARADL